MQIGIIGTGRHGSRYAEHIINDVDGLQLTAISRRSAAGLEQAANWGVSYYEDWRELVRNPQVEAVIAVTHPVLNVEIARHCAAAGKPLLMEKPLAVDRASGEAIVNLCEEAGLPLTVGQTLRYNKVIRALRHSLSKVGDLFSFSASHRLEPSTLAWLEDPEAAGAGVILHTAVHMFDALRYITGLEVVRVRACSFQVHNPKLEDLFTAQVEMENGVVGTVDASKIGRGRVGRYEFVGLDGELHGDQIRDRLEFISGTEVEPLSHGAPQNTIVPLLTDWSSFLEGRAANPIPGKEGLAALNICDACLRSARSDDWVELANLL